MINLPNISDHILETGTIYIMVSRNDFISPWKIAREETYSSISSIHFGHYKSAATSDLLRKINDHFSYIYTHMERPISQWPKVLQEILLKEAGNSKVDKIGAISLK